MFVFDGGDAANADTQVDPTNNLGTVVSTNTQYGPEACVLLSERGHLHDHDDGLLSDLAGGLRQHDQDTQHHSHGLVGHDTLSRYGSEYPGRMRRDFSDLRERERPVRSTQIRQLRR